MKRIDAKRAFRPCALACSLALAGCATTGEEPLFRDGTYVPSSAAQTREQAARAQPVAPPSALMPSASPGTGERVIRPVGGSRPAGDRPSARRPAADVEDQVVLNFQDAEIQAVISALARFLGRNFLMDPRVKGQITLVSDGEIGADTAYGMLVSALRMRGFTIVDVGSVSRVVPVADARLQGGAVDDPAAGGGIATRTFRLAYENAEALVPVLKPMIAPENSIAAYAANNTIVITDYVDNLERIARIVESIDTPTALDTEVVKVHNGVAVDIAGLAGELLQQGGSNAQRDIAVLADPRSNSIVIRASSPARTALARDLIIKLDNAQDDPGNLHVVYLRNAQATSLAGVLRGLLTGESGDVALGSGDSARAALGAGGMLSGGGSTGTTGRAANTSGTTTSGSGLAAGGSQRFGANTGGAGAQQQNGGTAFSANGVTVQADATTNTLIISAPEPMYRSLRRVIDLLDQRRAQVLVESLIVEVVEEDAAELGIQWMRQGGRFIGGTNLGGAGLDNDAANTIDLLPRGLNLGVIDGTINLPGVGEIMNLEVLARALQTRGGANILSTPNILTLDNEAASIMVGKTIPFVSGQYITSGSSGSDNPFQTVEREDVGLKLQIRPQISEGGTVKLDIYQEVSSIDEQNSGIAGIVTNKRALDTSVLLDDGQIMVLGGLLEDSVNNGSDAVPVLGSIPLLGHLFRYERRQRVKTNLMIFLRPYVIRDANAGRGLTQDRYDFMRTAQSRVQPGRHPLLPDIAAPILPPADLPVAGRRPALDLRPEQWPRTREQEVPPTGVSSAVRERPAAPEDDTPGVTGDLAALYAAPAGDRTVVQVADVRQEEDATRIARRVRISGLPAYIVTGPGGMGYAVRVDLPRDARAVDVSTEVLRELGYRPELVVTP
ncbi:type II secretion system secretin GspD [Pseudothauera rhizosphaerae]|uniref:Type II secretion system protein GspD n=1 Tax=Pseudothauera rhizosphaerae TaxID=2565932 RepID=A0A4S4ALN7_9RHOO|nr:type II secretion system secretin GspD [Pseudothauera rhizosphaerae]THF60460.1 type II secretion system protein GspD [Pseudothauera rhizosphaerae]